VLQPRVVARRVPNATLRVCRIVGVDRISQDSIKLASGHFSFLRSGRGRRLLMLLHGFPDHPPTFEKLIALLAAGGYDVVAPWLRGYAPSTLEGPYDIDQIARAFASEGRARAGHFLALEAPEWVAERALQWLDRFAEQSAHRREPSL